MFISIAQEKVSFLGSNKAENCFGNTAKIRYHLPIICNHIEFYNPYPNELQIFILKFRGNCNFLHELVNNLHKLQCECSHSPNSPLPFHFNLKVYT